VKIGLYNSGRRPSEADEQAKDDFMMTDESVKDELSRDESARDHETRPEVDPKVKSLIQSVAFEIQKSFSQRNLRKAST
jgi:hypothetical protein